MILQPHMCFNAADELLDLRLLVHEDNEKATKLTYNVLPCTKTLTHAILNQLTQVRTWVGMIITELDWQCHCTMLSLAICNLRVATCIIL